MATIRGPISPGGGFDIDGKTANLPLKYVVEGTTNEAAVHVLVAATAPLLYLGLVRQSFKAEELGGGLWFVEVPYGVMSTQQAFDPGSTPGGDGGAGSGASSPSDTDALDPGYSFDTTGNTVHVTQSRRTVDSSGGAPDTRQVIGITPFGTEVAGTDIVAPGFKWSRSVRRQSVKLPYLRTLAELTGSVNIFPFYGFDVGEVLYLGASGHGGGGNVWEITHNFVVSKNEHGLDVGIRESDGVTPVLIPDKDGWDYVWVMYEPGVVANAPVPRPKHWFVERVYLRKNFSLLEIGT